MISVNPIRSQLWEKAFSKTPSSDFRGTLPEQRERFIGLALDCLCQASGEPDTSLVDDVAALIRYQGGTWPIDQPSSTINCLVDIVTDDPSAERKEAAERTLQLLLFAFNGTQHSAGRPLHRDQEMLVDTMLRRIEQDVDLCLQGKNPKALQLAVLLAANYAAIHSRRQRAELIELLKTVVESSSVCRDPFIEDLLLIYAKMGLKELEEIYEQNQQKKH